MIPIKLNLTVPRGGTWSKGFQWIDKETMLPRDLTGCVFKMQVRAEKTYPPSPVLAEFSSSNGKFVINAPDLLIGKWEIRLNNTDVLGLTFQKALYDIDITFPSGDVFTPVEGTFDPNFKVTL